MLLLVLFMLTNLHYNKRLLNQPPDNDVNDAAVAYASVGKQQVYLQAKKSFIDSQSIRKVISSKPNLSY